MITYQLGFYPLPFKTVDLASHLTLTLNVSPIGLITCVSATIEKSKYDVTNGSGRDNDIIMPQRSFLPHNFWGDMLIGTMVEAQ